MNARVSSVCLLSARSLGIRLLAMLAMAWLVTGCRSMENYQAAAMPRFDGKHARGGLVFDGTLTVVTWNIKFAAEVDAAIQELQSTPALADADILLLQEMDEEGVWKIARTLAYDYVYFPASVHTANGKNFGNAVLSKWSIVDADKILLPHRNPKNDQARIAVQATIAVDNHNVIVYSVHTETMWLSGEKRVDQVEVSAGDIDEAASLVIVGGDFNTLTPLAVDDVDAVMGAVDLTRVSAAAPPTFRVAGVGVYPDHIYARGFTTTASGVSVETHASDHLPLWVELAISATP